LPFDEFLALFSHRDTEGNDKPIHTLLNSGICYLYVWVLNMTKQSLSGGW